MYFVILMVSGGNGPVVNDMVCIVNPSGMFFQDALKAAVQKIAPRTSPEDMEIITKNLDFAAYCKIDDPNDPKWWQLIWKEKDA